MEYYMHINRKCITTTEILLKLWRATVMHMYVRSCQCGKACTEVQVRCQHMVVCAAHGETLCGQHPCNNSGPPLGHRGWGRLHSVPTFSQSLPAASLGLGDEDLALARCCGCHRCVSALDATLWHFPEIHKLQHKCCISNQCHANKFISKFLFSFQGVYQQLSSKRQ